MLQLQDANEEIFRGRKQDSEDANELAFNTIL